MDATGGCRCAGDDAGAAAWFGTGSTRPASGGSRIRARAKRRLGAATRRTALPECDHRARTTDRAAETAPSTRAVASEIAESLKSIDRAIDDSRAALKVRPALVRRANQPARSAPHESRAAAGNRLAHERTILRGIADMIDSIATLMLAGAVMQAQHLPHLSHLSHPRTYRTCRTPQRTGQPAPLAPIALA